MTVYKKLRYFQYREIFFQMPLNGYFSEANSILHSLLKDRLMFKKSY